MSPYSREARLIVPGARRAERQTSKPLCTSWRGRPPEGEAIGIDNERKDDGAAVVEERVQEEGANGDAEGVTRRAVDVGAVVRGVQEVGPQRMKT